MIAEQSGPSAPGGSSLFTGAVWATLNAGLSVAFPLLLFVFFARVVPPAQLGVAAAALAALELIKALGPQGLYEALLQGEARLEEQQAATGLLLAAGAAGAALFVILTFAASGVWSELRGMRGAVALLAPKVLFDLLLLQPQAALARRAAFRPLAARVMIANLLAAIVGVGVALGVEPFWGLIGAYLAQSVFLFLFTAAWSRAFARPVWAPAVLRPMARQAGLASAVRLAGAANNYLDQVLLALFVPASSLARFNLGKRIEATLVTAQAAFSGVLFQPAFAAGDPQQRAQVIRRGRALLTAACGLPTAVFAANAEPLITLVFGARWAPAAIPAVLLAVGGAGNR
ncbi:oligosaccharide flippase family protein [Caulobacter sp. 17J65-9]|uniref:oligosaccharide flippase family protein n=1 Tax=Caulobacter sp. 17J65-9 TaxID=2709382 RepID=UPI0013CD1331|nr:oligosaccharide flippase family protein [Caulobacter sp. 17J65-9]NEX94077.1 oligosaccharide flippase family protein [Caulobacter sp. 17J65-9]